MTVEEGFRGYHARLTAALAAADLLSVERLYNALSVAWQEGRGVFLCGNGGSAGNSLHLVNDLIYGIGQGDVPGIKAQALPANPATITCLGNDRGYDKIFSLQLRALASLGDVLIVLSGSGNSQNILDVLAEARARGVMTFGIFGFDGGRSKQEVDVAIHFPVYDMQIAEDLQLIVGHMVVQALMRSPVRRSA